MSRKRVAIVEPDVLPGGGTEAVASWGMEALKNDYDVTLITFSQIDVNILNQYYVIFVNRNQKEEDDTNIWR